LDAVGKIGHAKKEAEAGNHDDDEGQEQHRAIKSSWFVVSAFTCYGVLIKHNSQKNTTTASFEKRESVHLRGDILKYGRG